MQFSCYLNLSFHSFTFVAATIVLSSTAGATKRSGSRLGEFVNAGDYKGRPFFTRRHTEGNVGVFMYSEKGVKGKNEWFLREDINRK